MKLETARTLGCMLCYASLIAPASAAHWTLLPSGNVTSGYQVHPYFQEDADGLASAASQFAIELKRQTERLDIGLTPNVSMSRFPQAASLDNDVKQLDLSLRQLGTLVSFTGNVHWQRDTTLTSEAQTTGFTTKEKRTRDVSSVIFGPVWRATDATVLNSQLQWSEIGYDAPETSGLTSYRYGSLLLGVSHDWSERTAFTINAQAGEIDMSNGSANTRNASLRIGLRYMPAAAWSTDLSFGPSWVDVASSRSNGFVYNLGARRRGETIDLDMQALRVEEPSSRGGLRRREELSTGLVKRFSERVTGSLTSSLARTRSASELDRLLGCGVLDEGGSACAFERLQFANSVTLARAEARAAWWLTQTWNLSFGVSYSSRRADRERDDSYGASLGLAWRGNALEL